VLSSSASGISAIPAPSLLEQSYNCIRIIHTSIIIFSDITIRDLHWKSGRIVLPMELFVISFDQNYSVF